jgi:hypothetical protein
MLPAQTYARCVVQWSSERGELLQPAFRQSAGLLSLIRHLHAYELRLRRRPRRRFQRLRRPSLERTATSADYPLCLQRSRQTSAPAMSLLSAVSGTLPRDHWGCWLHVCPYDTLSIVPICHHLPASASDVICTRLQHVGQSLGRPHPLPRCLRYLVIVHSTVW